MHIHTFCASGVLDGMPSKAAWCAEMAALREAPLLAREMLSWAPRPCT